jgi:hypothetical protein
MAQLEKYFTQPKPTACMESGHLFWANGFLSHSLKPFGG